jgi:hypothetical protein
MKRRERKRDGFPPKQVNPLKSRFLDCLLTLPNNWVEASYEDLSKPFILGIMSLIPVMVLSGGYVVTHHVLVIQFLCRCRLW